MTSDNVQYPIGTIVREDHKNTDGTDGHTTWVLVEDHVTVGNEVVETYPSWLVLFSTSVGNLGEALGYDELPSDHIKKIGVVPGTPAEQEEQASLDKVVRGSGHPRITWGTKPDGSPWAVHVDFGSSVAINSTGDIWDNKRVITTTQADRKSVALEEAMNWVVNGLVALSEHNRAFQLRKQKPKKTRIAVDKVGYLFHREPRSLLQGADLLPWVRKDTIGTEQEIRSTGDGRSGLIELTDMESITVTATSGMAVAAFMGGTLKPAQRTGDLYDVEVPGDGRVGLQLLTRIWRIEDAFYVAHKGSSLVIPVRLGA